MIADGEDKMMHIVVGRGVKPGSDGIIVTDVGVIEFPFAKERRVESK